MTALLRFALRCIGWLPLPLLHACGTLLGALAWWIPNSARAVTLHHLRRCFPEWSEDQRRRVARASLRHMAMTVLEAPALWFGPEARLRRWIDDGDAARQLRELLAQHHGLIVLCPHIGSWELVGLFCSANAPMTTLYKPQNGAMDALILEGRTRLGAQLVPTAGNGVRALLQALREGRAIGILPDHDPPEGAGDFAPLFGIAAHTTTLVGKLAARQSVPVWFCYAERCRFGRGFRIHFGPAPEGIADPARSIAALNQGVELIVRHLPEQYWWRYRRFRRQPAGAADFYAPLREMPHVR